VHQSPITQSGWTGTGYIITDPVTGAGAYKISGGANGAFLQDASIVLVMISLIGATIEASAFFMLAITLISIYVSIVSFLVTATPCGNATDDVSFWLTAILALTSGVIGFYGNASQNVVIAFAA
jgi:hypothetical protein